MQAIISPVKVEERKKLGIRPGDTVRVEQRITEVKKSKGADKKEKSTKTTRTQGFEGLETEWWHFTLRDEPYPETFFDFPVSRASLSG